MRLLGASFKKTAEKPTASAYATELKRLNSSVERIIGQFMRGFLTLDLEEIQYLVSHQFAESSEGGPLAAN